MLVKVKETCGPDCGVVVEGELDTSTREFVHRFCLPPGAESLVQERHTEVEGIRLLTLAPDTRQWAVECPICRKSISISRGEA